jgi:hypothetical protein
MGVVMMTMVSVATVGTLVIMRRHCLQGLCRRREVVTLVVVRHRGRLLVNVLEDGHS